jgi:hypothetical protein
VSAPSGKANPAPQTGREKIHELLISSRTKDDVTLYFRDGSKVTGGVVYNELKGYGRIIDVEHEISRDFTIEEIIQAVPVKKPPGKP